jgi:putative hydrolase of the HAD superfamily
LLLPTAAIAYVGDDPQLDVAAAQAAGLRTVWMNRRALPWPGDLPPADLVVSDCVQLAAALHT